MQIICQLPLNNVSPTLIAFIIKTINRFQRLAENCNKTKIYVTYDLAIEATVLVKNKPIFDNPFIQI